MNGVSIRLDLGVVCSYLLSYKLSEPGALKGSFERSYSVPLQGVGVLLGCCCDDEGI